MKFLAVFAAFVAISAAAPTTSWTLNDLSQALQNPATPAAILPYLENALNEMMNAIFAGHQIGSIVVPTPAGLLPVEAVSPAIVMPAEVDLVPSPTTSWTLSDLSQAIQNPATPAALLPYLEHALNEMMNAIFAGQPIDTITVPTPAGLLPVEAVSPVIVMPAEVDPTPVAPAPVPAPIVPAPVADAASPLVQIIVNIKSQESVIPEAVYEPQPVPAPVIVPEPVIVVEQPSPVVVPEPIEIGPAPGPVVIVPEPVIVAPEIPSPIVIGPAPVEIPNPIDVIAVGAPDFNPIDLLQPVPVNVVGPMI